jgi:hypothetical protein
MTAPVPAQPPIVKTVRVPWDPAAAFRRFTAEIGTWWPLRTHSVGGTRAVAVRFEEQVGGRIVESVRSGEPCVWGTVTAWEEGTRVAFTWHPGQEPSVATQVDVRFEADGTGTRVTLTHTGWEAYGAKARRTRGAYGPGWEYVLAHFTDRTTRMFVFVMDLVIVPLVAFRRGRRLLATAGVALLLTAAAHTYGAVQPVPPNSPAETITEEMAAVRFPLGMGMSPSMLDIFQGLSFTMTVFLVWAGLSTLVAAAHGTRQDVQRRAWSGLALAAVLAYLNWQFRIPPPMIAFAVAAALFAGAAVIASLDRGGVRG